ncbi:hypothetical protein Syun_019439 [Stephania yunnanensis]|uniref:Uncharacterized protein n=1 Tax=Stephania yunnanensis TaxID=152371 RepID=A0AAP0NVX4_9MAGN
MTVVSFSRMIGQRGKVQLGQNNTLMEVEKIDSSSDIDCEVACTTKMPSANEDVEITSTTSRSCTTTPNGDKNPSKKKKKVNNNTYLGDQMALAAHVVASEISKISKMLHTEQDMRDLFLDPMGEVNELNNVEKTIYGSKIMGRVEHMTIFLKLKPELHYD